MQEKMLIAIKGKYIKNLNDNQTIQLLFTRDVVVGDRVLARSAHDLEVIKMNKKTLEQIQNGKLELVGKVYVIETEIPGG